MTFKEAVEKLVKDYPNEYHVIRFEVMIHHDGRSEESCQLYIANGGWTDDLRTYEEAFRQLAEKVRAKKNALAKIVHEKLADPTQTTQWPA